MKKALSMVLSLVLLLSLFPAAMPAAALSEGDLGYSIQNGEVTIKGGNKDYAGALVIPDTIEGYPVTKLSMSAFHDWPNLTEVTIPASVTYISFDSFRGCDNLKAIRVVEDNPNFSHDSHGVLFDKSMRRVLRAPGGLSGCYKMPEGVKIVESWAFSGCKKLTEVLFPQSLGSIKESGFEGCINLKEVYLPNGFGSLGSRAFADCDSLTNVVLPGTMDNMGSMAFHHCDNLEKVVFEQGAAHVGAMAFAACRKLTTVTLVGDFEHIGYCAFAVCSSLRNFTCSGKVGWIGNSAFDRCISLLNVKFPYVEGEIGEKMFIGCTALESVEIAEGNTKTGDGMFLDCSNLRYVRIPYTVTTIGAKTFYGSGLTAVTVPSSVTSIGEQAFGNNCTSILFKGDAPDFAENAFGDTEATVYYPAKNLTWTKDIRKQYGENLTWKTDCDGHIPGRWFTSKEPTDCEDGWRVQHCTLCNQLLAAKLLQRPSADRLKQLQINLTQFECIIMGSDVDIKGELIIPASIHGYPVTSIAGNGLQWRPQLTSIYVPGSVHQVRPAAFLACRSLHSITLPDHMKAIPYASFSNCDALTEITLPADLEVIGDSAFINCDRLTHVTFPETLTMVGDHAFAYCDELKNVYFSGNRPEFGCNANGEYSPFEGISVTVHYHAGAEGWRDITPEMLSGGTGRVQFKEMEHIYSLEEMLVNNKGSNTVVCLRCGAEETVTVTCSEHMPGDWVVAKAPTDQEEGLREQQCTVCHEVVASEILQKLISGKSGENVTWCLDPNSGLLTVSGTGAMKADYIPWIEYRSVITAVEVGEGVETLCSGAFEKCSELSRVQLPSTLKAIPYCAFNECTALTRITLPENVTEIGKYAFFGCSALEQIDLPEHLTELRYCSFAYCKAMKNFTVPAQVTVIDSSVFHTDALDTLTFLGNAPALAEAAFKNLTATVRYPAGNETWNDVAGKQYGGTVTWEAWGDAVVQPVLTLKSPTLEFKDMITVNAIYTAENTEDVVEMGMITYGEQVEQWSVETADHVIPGAEYIAETGCYVSASQGIHAKHLGDTLYLACYAKLKDGSCVYTKLAPYSPVQYASNQLKNSTDMKLKQLVAAMLNYGAVAQLHFGHNVDTLANATMTAEQKQLPESYRADMVSSVPAAALEKQGEFANNQGFGVRKPAISFEGAFSIHYFFKPNYAPVDGITLYYWNGDDYAATDVLTAENATGSFRLKGSGTEQYSGDIQDIAAKNLSGAVYVAAVYSDGSTTWTSGVLGYSIGAYCGSLSAKGGTIADLAMATAAYGYHAEQYFG